MGVYYVHKYRVQWLRYDLSCVDKDKEASILQQEMLIRIMSRDMITQLRVGLIYYMPVTMTMRQLA